MLRVSLDKNQNQAPWQNNSDFKNKHKHVVFHLQCHRKTAYI